MSTLAAFIAAPPDWLLPLGWLVLLLGWVLGRPATQRFVSKVTFIGFGNTTNNTVNQGHTSSHTASTPGAGSASSTLTNASGWATVIGLAITLWPAVKPWLNLGA